MFRPRFIVAASFKHLEKTILSLAEGDRVEAILKDFPTLTEEDVRAVIAFAAASAEEDLPPIPLPRAL